MKPLWTDWRGTLRAEPAAVAGSVGRLHLDPEADWAAREFGRGSHPDGRVRSRIEAIGRCWEERPGAPLPVIFPERVEQDAAYRLLSNPRVSMDDILESHREISSERCKVVGVALLIQDTTMLNYNTLRFSAGGWPRSAAAREAWASRSIRRWRCQKEAALSGFSILRGTSAPPKGMSLITPGTVRCDRCDHDLSGDAVRAVKECGPRECGTCGLGFDICEEWIMMHGLKDEAGPGV